MAINRKLATYLWCEHGNKSFKICTMFGFFPFAKWAERRRRKKRRKRERRRRFETFHWICSLNVRVWVCGCVKTNVFSLTLKDIPNKIYQSISDEWIRWLEFSSPVQCSLSLPLSPTLFSISLPATRLAFFPLSTGCFSISIRAI